MTANITEAPIPMVTMWAEIERRVSSMFGSLKKDGMFIFCFFVFSFFLQNSDLFTHDFKTPRCTALTHTQTEQSSYTVLSPGTEGTVCIQGHGLACVLSITFTGTLE